ncbi:MAG: BLUF domain-containing protein [Anaerolineae bacterium]|jgi:hypothetical protein|nr:BLUF domain-containing protein [Anaerolineae bacterium]
MTLYRLIYKSASTRPFTSDFVKSLEDVSKTNNTALDVTGVLVSTKSGFLQVLEGEQKNVNAVYNKICIDPRHSDIELISYDRISQRAFPDWSMKCLSTGIMGRIVAEQLKKKYGEQDSDLDLPSDGDKAFALLFDLAFLQKSGDI